MDHRELMSKAADALLDIKMYAEPNPQVAFRTKHELMEMFIKQIATHRDVFVTAPDYIVKLAKEIDKIPYINVKISG